MTICIAAECESGAKIVVAADRMFTLTAPANLEFETQEKKIEELAPACIVLSSGNSAYAKEILQIAMRHLGGNQKPPIVQAVEILKDAYLDVRALKVREQIVIPMLGPDFLKFERTINMPLPQYLQFQPAIFQQLTAQMSFFNMNMDFLVCGVGEDGAHIAYIGHPGTIVWLDKLGHAAIGSGGIHATTRLSLGSQTKDSSFVETLYRVYEAKKAAEVAPGVGKETDIAMVAKDRTQYVSTATLKHLDDIFHGARTQMLPSLGELQKLLEKENQ